MQGGRGTVAASAARRPRSILDPRQETFLPGLYREPSGIEMPEDKQIRGPSDIGYINLPSEAERCYWAKEFGCSEEQLKDAVAAVGPLVVDVRWHLGSHCEAGEEADQSACATRAKIR
jgi:hypothetical protein